MTPKENYFRSVYFKTPDYIPVTLAVNPSCWKSYDHSAIFDLLESHPFLFPNFNRPPKNWTPSYVPITQAGTDFVDDFGCIWRTAQNSMTETVCVHPLSDWDKFST